jgi:hypothetical protein
MGESVQGRTVMSNYLIANGLADENLNLTETPDIPEDARLINDSPLFYDEAAIYLCACIKIVQHSNEIEFGLKPDGELYWNIYVWCKEDKTAYYEEHPTIGPTIRTIETLLPYMAGSNVSYLAGNMKYDT